MMEHWLPRCPAYLATAMPCIRLSQIIALLCFLVNAGIHRPAIAFQSRHQTQEQCPCFHALAARGNPRIAFQLQLIGTSQLVWTMSLQQTSEGPNKSRYKLTWCVDEADHVAVAEGDAYPFASRWDRSLLPEDQGIEVLDLFAYVCAQAEHPTSAEECFEQPAHETSSMHCVGVAAAPWVTSELELVRAEVGSFVLKALRPAGGNGMTDEIIYFRWEGQEPDAVVE